LFDHIEVEIPLPDLPLDFTPHFQTKSLASFMDRYRIDTDGALWIQNYDIEDRSDPNAKGISRLVGIMTRVNQHWVRSDYTGEIRFYDTHPGKEWFEYSTYFERGQLVRGPHRLT
jgi:hypothetical protein